MNQTSLRRRLVAGAAGLVLGAAGTLAAASPAYAHDVLVSGTAECDTTTGEFVVQWIVASDRTELTTKLTNVTAEPTADLGDIAIGAEFPAGGQLQGTQRIAGDSGMTEATLSVEVQFVHDDGRPKHNGRDSATVPLQGTCEPDGGGGGGTEPPDDQMPPELKADFFPVVSCDFLVFFVNNRGEEEGITMAFTPNQDAVHGHAPDFLEFLDEFLAAEPGEVVELPDDVGLVTEGDNVGEIGAGESTVALGPFPTGGAHAHGFEGAEGLVVTVDLMVGDTEVELEGGNEFAFDELLGDLDCDEDAGDGGDDGQGGELPQTGSSTMLITGGAVALLVLGGGLYLLARRRRVTFTA